MHPRKRGRPSKIGFDQIVAAALRIGLRDLTMTRLARELDVAMSTLYHHVSGIDVVNAAVADQLIEDVDLLIQGSDTTDLTAFLLKAGRRLRAVFVAAPGFADIARNSPRLTGRILAVHERAAQRLVAMGLDELHAFLTVRALADYVEAMVARDELWASQGDTLEVIRDNRQEAAASGCTALVGAYDKISADYPDQQFEFGLLAMANGLAEMAKGHA